MIWSKLLAAQAGLIAVVFSSFAVQAQSKPNGAQPEITLQGVVSGSQNHSYIEVPFHVPAGVHRVTVTFSYTERNQKTTLDLGLEDPAGFRCWSGGNKSTLTVGFSDATPSCLPGPIPAGEWNVLIGVPNIRPNVTSHYTATVFLSRSGLVSDEPPVLRQPLRTGPGWYRGDLHMHTGHSDGRCPNQTGQMVPCPVFMTVEAAVKRGLDFIAITDHNATSQYDAMRELQPYFDTLLLIPGREITTFQGHMNIFGTTDFVDFRVGSKSVPDVNVLLQRVKQMDVIASINHPNSPTGEICMGCGWTPAVPVQMNLFTAIETVNGGNVDPASSGISFWEQQLNQGYRLTAIGGSDNHMPLLPPEAPNAVGHPTTVVYAQELSTPAILDGIRSGRVFVDVTGSRDRLLEVSARTNTSAAVMGGDLRASAGQEIEIEAHISGCNGASAELISGGKPVADAPKQAIREDRASMHWTMKAAEGRQWVLVQVRDLSGNIVLLGNPIFVNWTGAPSSQAR